MKEDALSYIRDGLRVVETSAHVDELPDHDGFALAVGFDGEGFVMVRSAKEGRAWELPGGKVEENETFAETARREFREETGRVLRDASPAAVVVETYNSENRTKVVDGVVFAGKADEKVGETDREIEETGVFEGLPDELTRITFERRTFETLVGEARLFVNENSDE